MIKICILGDIGSGKTFVANQFGFPVFNADKEVSKIYKNNRSCSKKFKKNFPNHIFSFPIRKKELGKLIIENKKNIKTINKIVHPLVRTQMYKFLKKNRNKKAVILDIPLLLENKLNKKNHILIFVQAKKKDINKRLKLRLNYNLKIIKELKKLQLPIEIKKKKSDFIIKNNFKRLLLKKNVKVIKYKIFAK